MGKQSLSANIDFCVQLADYYEITPAELIVTFIKAKNSTRSILVLHKIFF